MLYIDYPDFAMQVKADQLEVLIQQNPLVMAQAIRTAVGEAETYLRSRYDVATIFGQRGENRHFPLLTYVVDMAIYHLHAHLAPGKMPDMRGIRYDAAIGWLKDVRDGKNSVLLPTLPQAENIGSSVSFGKWDNSKTRI